MGLLVALRALVASARLPERRKTTKALIWVAILFMGKFYARELNLGQTNILLGGDADGALPRGSRARHWLDAAFWSAWPSSSSRTR